MAPSLRDLIDHLLADIALCGDQGATPEDVLESIKAFYAKTSLPTCNRTHTVDRRFQEKVWTWLTRNPEVSVGQDKEGNHLSLADAEARAQSSEPLRVFVSKERTWLALTGHEPDDTKVFPTEFALLSIIASHKSKGIAQTDLVRLSGQDKRSVPKRTDTLQRKGYIQKRAVQIKSARTSLCTLRRFLQDEDNAPESEPKSADRQDQMIDFHKFMDDLFGILREHRILSRADLKNLLGFADRWRWRILSRTLRKFERIGVLKRVRALSQYADTINKYHPCVMLVREPTEKDYERFYEFGIDSLTSNEQEDNDELDEEMEVNDTGQPSVSLQKGVLQQEQDVQDVGRTIPSWTPDRILHNQIFDIVHQAGIDGMVSLNLIKSCFGGFYRRPLENVLARLVECWQLSQPVHLRHLALVRDTAMTGTIHHYIHYSALNFGKRVDAGVAAWEAVEFFSKNAKTNNLRPPPVDAVPDVDEYGFPLTRPKAQLLKNGNASLLECMAVVKPRDYVVTSTDPSAVQRQDGTYGLRVRQRVFVGDHHRRGGPEVSTPRKVKLEHKEAEDVEMGNTPEVSKPTRGRPKKIKDEELLRGMSKKERLEHLGLDESYTEYSVLLIDRPNPGVYITALGRRRPAGQRQGRPKRSRLAVFKSPKLSSFPWFVEEAGELPDVPQSDAGRDTPMSTAGPTDTGGLRGTKRPLHLSSGRDSDAESPVVSKQRRLVGGEEDSMDIDTPERHVSANVGRSSKRKRAGSPDESGQEVRTAVTSTETPSKRPHHVSGGGHESVPSSAVPENDGASEEPVEGTHEKGPPSPPTEKPSAEAAPVEIASTNAPPTTPSISSSKRKAHPTATPAAAEPTSSPAPASSTGKMRGPRGHMSGSIGFQRRKIVMQILEQAGGAFPMGTELWYPFTTAWAKLNYKEKPDLRTIRGTVKHLIDAGTLRQFTFSGKDSKGLMVTKSIIAKSDMSPEDPLIQDMQKKMLATDSRFYIPDNVEYDKEMTKSGKKIQAPPHGKASSRIPIESRLTVHLHQKPALVTAQERRRGQMIQRQLLQRLDSERELLKGPNVIRLMRIRRAPGQDTAHGLTSISRPDRAEGQRQRRIQKVQSSGGIRRVRLIDTPISMIAPYAMIMSPQQEFHASSGTFSTTAGLAALQISKPRGTPKEPSTPRGSRKHTASILPDSLDDLFNMAQRRQRGPVDPDRRFLHDTSTIMRWELRNEELFRRKSADFHYINQTVQDAFESAPIAGDIRFQGHEEPPTSPPQFLPPEPRATRHATRTKEALAEETLPPLAPRPPGLPRYDVDTEMDGGGRRPAVKSAASSETTRRNRRLEKMHASLASSEGDAIPTQQTGRRSHKSLYVLSKSFVRKLMTAVVVVRTLAGGWEGKIVDWTLVPKCFPEFDPIFVQERGKSIVSKHRLQLAKMQGDFQSLFIEAYANGEVPAINYDDLENYDWEGVVEWANSALEFPNSEKIPDLPATREQFDSVFEVREEPVSSLDDIYQSSHNVTIYRKRTAYAETPFAVPFSGEPAPMNIRKAELARLDAAKTWVRANIVAAEESYRPAEAREILSSVPNSVLENALNSLMTERVISSNNKGRPAPGRNYDITDYFLLLLGRKRAFESTDLRRAARFKTDILDPALQSQGQWDFDYAADDGDTMVMINLLAEGRVDLRPRDPPRDRYGLTEGGYTTRQMDKGKLRFAVEVRPVKGKYVYGNPIQEKTSSITPPCPSPVTVGPSQLAVPERIPLWYDIHSQFVKLLWDIALTAVVSCVALRPGLSASGVANMLKPTMGAWEVELLLQWLEQAGVMRQVGGHGAEAGWTVQEWWWLVLGSG